MGVWHRGKLWDLLLCLYIIRVLSPMHNVSTHTLHLIYNTYCSEADMTGTECLECNEPCIEIMFGCAGLPRVVDTTPATGGMGEGQTSSPTSSPKPSPPTLPTSPAPQSSADTDSSTTSPVAEAETAVPPPAPTPPTDRENNAASSFNGRYLYGLFSMLVVIALAK